MNDAHGPGRMLMNVDVERLARTIWPDELREARPWTVSRRMGDVRDVLEGLPVSTVTEVERAKILRAYSFSQSPTPETISA